MWNWSQVSELVDAPQNKLLTIDQRKNPSSDAFSESRGQITRSNTQNPRPKSGFWHEPQKEEDDGGGHTSLGSMAPTLSVGIFDIAFHN